MLAIELPVIHRLRALLDELEYDAVQRTLRPHYFAWPFPPLDLFKKLVLYLPERLRVSYEVLLLGQPVPRSRLERLWGVDAVDDLLALGLLVPRDRHEVHTDNYSIVSYLGRYFVVSVNPYYPTRRDPDAPVYIGPDSLTLAAALPASGRWQRCLDLCTGSGIQAIMLAASAQQVVAAEIHPLAANAARFNAALNHVEDRVEVHHGHLYDPVPAGPYDLIVSNPPFLPVPAGVHHALAGHGGEDGLSVLGPLLEGIPPRLSDRGEALIYAEGVGDGEGPFVRQRLQELAAAHRLDVHLLLVSRLSIKSTLILKAASLAQLQRPSSELAQWRDLYQRLGATHSYNYLLRLRRGDGAVVQVAAFDPHREERGIELQPGVVVKPR
jgi:release factor glutamine methyltransferase